MCKEPRLEGPKRLLQLLPHVLEEKSWAQLELALCYRNGAHGLKENLKMALSLIVKAVEQENRDALTALGHMYYYGDVVEYDMAKAMKLWKKAAEQGCTEAQCLLGDMYYNSDGVEEDKAKAVELWANAAERGHQEAQDLLDEMYYWGELQSRRGQSEGGGTLDKGC